MKKIITLLCLSIIFSHIVLAQIITEKKLWGSNKPIVYNVTDSTDAIIHIYSPEQEKNTGIAIIVCPGGGYARLAIDHEGHQMAEWLSSEGITGVVLQYRLPHGNKEVPIADVREATRYIRSMKDTYSIDTDKIGVMGFSAGGHLASTHLTILEDSLSYPNFGVLFYPVITSDERYIHKGSFDNLLGSSATVESKTQFSNELNITSDTPPTILFHSNDDRVSPINSVLFYEGLKNNNIESSALYIFPTGGHGWGFRSQFAYHDAMKSLLFSWIMNLND